MNKEEWVNYFKEQIKVDVKISKINENWEVMTMVMPKNESRIRKTENFFESSPQGTARASYVLHCLKCGTWFFNGWYQTECSCGNKIPDKFWYP
jgi:hypothetical protein